MQLATAAQQQPDTDKRSKPLKVTGRLKQALDLMIWGDGERHYLSDNEAAVKTGMNVLSIRIALQQPHVLAYYKQQREVLRASLLPGNIHRAKQIRDKADNMPAMHAIKYLEQLPDDMTHGRSGVSASPGVTIRVLTIVQGNTQPGAVPTYRDSMSGTDAKQINDLAESDRS